MQLVSMQLPHLPTPTQTFSECCHQWSYIQNYHNSPCFSVSKEAKPQLRRAPPPGAQAGVPPSQNATVRLHLTYVSHTNLGSA